MNNTKTLIGIVTILIIVGCVGVMSIPITKQVVYDTKESYTVEVPYEVQESYTVQVPYEAQESSVIKVPYNTKESYTIQVPYESPITETVDHRDPVYKTLYTFTLKDNGAVQGTCTNVYNYDWVHTGYDFWNNKEYMWTFYYYKSIPDGIKEIVTYKEIDSYNKVSFQGIVTYNEWSEEVILGYETKYNTETN